MGNNIKINTNILECLKDIKKEDIDVSVWKDYKLVDMYDSKKNKKIKK